jgi:hypothetical protein
MNKTDWVTKRVTELMLGRYRWNGVDNMRYWLESLNEAEAEIVEDQISNLNFGALKQQVFSYAWTSAYDVAVYELERFEELQKHEQNIGGVAR